MSHIAAQRAALWPTAPPLRPSATAWTTVRGIATPCVGPVASGRDSYHAWHANACAPASAPTPSEPAAVHRAARRKAIGTGGCGP